MCTKRAKYHRKANTQFTASIQFIARHCLTITTGVIGIKYTVLCLRVDCANACVHSGRFGSERLKKRPKSAARNEMILVLCLLVYSFEIWKNKYVLAHMRITCNAIHCRTHAIKYKLSLFVAALRRSLAVSLSPPKPRRALLFLFLQLLPFACYRPAKKKNCLGASHNCM